MGAVVAPVNINPQGSQTTLPDIQPPLPIRPPRRRRHAAQVPWHAARALAGAGGWNLTKATQALKEIKCLCEGGQMVPLQDTILPLPKQLSARYTKQIERIPLLSLPTLLAGNDLGSWVFLREFGIIQAETLEIYMTVLASLSRSTGAVDPVGLCQLYGDINLQCMTGPKEQTDFVRQFFRDESVIFIPSRDGKEMSPRRWHALDDSYVMGAPADLRSKIPIDILHAPALPRRIPRTLSS